MAQMCPAGAMGVGCEDVVLGFLLVTRGGGLLKHALGVMLLAWRRMLLAGAAAFVAAVLIGEMAAVVASGRIPPPLMAQVVIAIFAVVVAYGTVVTVFLEELVQGLISMIRIIEGDAAAGARAAAAMAEREAGEVGTGLMRLFGGRRKPGPQAPPAAPPVSASAAVRGGEAGETEQAIAATEEFVTTAPRPRVDARPVRADQLPRIGWAAERDEGDETAPRAAVGGATRLIPPLEDTKPSPVVTPTPSPASPVPPLPVRTSNEPLAQPPMPTPPAEAAPATRPLPAEAAETWSPSSSVPVLPPSAQDAGGFGEPGRPTRPLSRPNSQPLDPGASGDINQALRGTLDGPEPGGDGQGSFAG